MDAYRKSWSKLLLGSTTNYEFFPLTKWFRNLWRSLRSLGLWRNLLYFVFLGKSENWAQICDEVPAKNVTRIFSCLFDCSLVENDFKSDRNPTIFLINAMEIPWLELVQNPCHVPAWTTNKIWINDMETSSNLAWISTKLPSICDMKFPRYFIRKWWDFYRIWSHFWPSCRQKDMRKSMSHFLQGWYKKSIFIVVNDNNQRNQIERVTCPHQINDI